MSNKEIDRFKVLQKVLDLQLLQKEAAIQLDLRVRQVKRRVKSISQFKIKISLFYVHGKLGIYRGMKNY